MFLIALITVSAALSAADEGRLKIATTSSLYDTGLLETIVDQFSEENSATVQIPSHGRSNSLKRKTAWRGGALLTTTSISWAPRMIRRELRV